MSGTKKSRQIGQRIKEFRENHYPSQKAFADDLGLGQTVVSAWERGDNMPSSEAWVKIATVAPSPDNLWFLRQAGLGREVIVAAAKALGEVRLIRPKERDVILIPRFRETKHGREEAGPAVPLPVEFIPNPPATICLSVDEESTAVHYSPRGLFVVDTSIEGAEDLSALWGRVVVIRYRPENAALSLLRGINIGRLMLRGDWGYPEPDSVRVSAYLNTLTADLDGYLELGQYIEPEGMRGVPPEDRIMQNWRVNDIVEGQRSKFRMDKGIEILGKVIGRLTGHLEIEEAKGKE